MSSTDPIHPDVAMQANRYTLRLHAGGKSRDFKRRNIPYLVAYAGRVFEIELADMRASGGVVNYFETHVENLHEGDAQ